MTVKCNVGILGWNLNYKKRFVEELVSLSIRIPGCKPHETEIALVKQGLWENHQGEGEESRLEVQLLTTISFFLLTNKY